MSRILTLLPLALLQLAVVTPGLEAQACMGQPAFSEAAKRVGGVAEIGSGYSLFQGNLTLSRPSGWFGILNAGISKPEFGDGGVRIGVDVGRDLDKWFKGKVKACGYAGIAIDKSDAFGVGSATDFRLGFAAGYPLSDQMSLVGSYTGIYERYSIGDGFGFEGSAEEYFGLIDAGLALKIGSNLVLTPGGRFYFRFGGGHDPSFVIKGSIGLK